MSATGRWFRRGALGVLALLLVLGGLFLAWASDDFAADPAALAALQSDAQVIVDTNGWTVFRPAAGGLPETGVIFYTGGKADPRAYAPLLRQIAAAGYLVVCPDLPLNLAVLAPERGRDAFTRFPEVRRWVIGGHSLGGAMAAGFAAGQPDSVAGLFLWAAYPAGSADLSGTALPVLSVYGTLDTWTTLDEIEASRRLLPPDTQLAGLDGADHFQFGSFREAPVNATLSRADQQALVVDATLRFLDGLSRPPATAAGR